MRSTNPSDLAKAELLKSFTDAGMTLLVGNVTAHASLVAALKQVEVVISAVGTAAVSAQINILEAAKEAGTIKRFLPSEFGGDPDRLAEQHVNNALAKFIFEPKQVVRRAAEKSGIPHTFLVSGCFAGWHLTRLGQDGTQQTPPRDEMIKSIMIAEENSIPVKCHVNENNKEHPKEIASTKFEEDRLSEFDDFQILAERRIACNSIQMRINVGQN